MSDEIDRIVERWERELAVSSARLLEDVRASARRDTIMIVVLSAFISCIVATVIAASYCQGEHDQSAPPAAAGKEAKP